MPNNNFNESLVKQIDLNQFKLDELTNKWKCKWQEYHEIFEVYVQIFLFNKNKNIKTSFLVIKKTFI